jgi:UDP-galactopyranose mutase
MRPNVAFIPRCIACPAPSTARTSSRDVCSPAAHHAGRRGAAGGTAAAAAGLLGVIDERLDTGLLATLSDRHPEWQIVMAGPVVKIDPATLPQSPNLHWLGMQPYGRLPYLMAGWDVALMPFSINASTRFISPTKTLEYMAGEKPVVSTAVQDGISLYGHVVEVAPDSDAFVAACEKLLAEDPAARCRRTLEMLAAVSMVSWDRAAQYVDTLLRSAVKEQAQAAQAPVPTLPVVAAAPRVVAAGA